MSRAFVFPGQGSQFVGMGKDLAEAYATARETFEEIDDTLEQNLSKLMFEGPEDELTLTENTQPALMAVSMAVMNILSREAGIKLEDICDYVAGHSLGEYSALCAAGAIELSDTARLLKLRGRAMQDAVPVGKGAMAAILGLEFEDVKAIAAAASNADICEAANDNSPGQAVVSGHKDAVEKAITLAQEKGAKKAVQLPVSAPFHSTLMAPAAQRMAEALADTDIRPPCVPVIANVTASPVSEPSDIRRLLVDQVTGMVRWRESVQWMAENGVTRITEIGAGKVLSGLIRRIDREIETSSVGTAEQLEALVAELKG